MLRRVRNPECAVIWLATQMPREPHKLFRVSEAYTRFRLRSTEYIHQVLARFGVTHRTDGNAKTTAQLRGLCHSNKSLIWTVITAVFNMRDNSMKDIEPQLRRLIELTQGEIIEGVPDKYRTIDYGKSDKTGTQDAYKEECAILSTTAAITKAEGEKLEHTTKHGDLENQDEVHKLRRWRLQQLYGDFFRHDEMWYLLYNAEETCRKFPFVDFAVRKFDSTQYHPGNTTQDRIKCTVEQAARLHKVDEQQGGRARNTEGSNEFRKLPAVLRLDYVLGLLQRLGFKNGMFSKEMVCMTEAQALEAFEYMHDLADKYPDAGYEYKRTNLSSALKQARKPSRSKTPKAGEPIVHKVKGTEITYEYWRRQDVCKWVAGLVSKTLDHITGLTLSWSPAKDTVPGYCVIEGFHYGEYYPKAVAGDPSDEIDLKPIWHGYLCADLLT
jgi:hypothetical protein